MNNETKHTPALEPPWHLAEQGPRVGPLVIDGAGWIVCQTARQHARFIVRACNAHAALEELSRCSGNWNTPEDVAEYVREVACAALKLAKGE